MPTVSTGRFDIFYTEEGSGFPVLLIHGLAGDHRAWRPQLDAFRDSYRVIAIDNPGSGDSSNVDGPVGTADLADATLTLLDALEIEEANVVGRSMGGAIAQHMALKAPERVRSMAMIASFARLDACGDRIIRNMKEILDLTGSWSDWSRHATWLFFEPTFFNDHPEIVAQIDAIISDESRDQVSYKNLADACIAHDALDRLGEIACPALIMAGERDPICSMTATGWMADALNQVETVIFERSSHFLLLEEAAKAQTTLANWLARQAPA